MRLWVDADAAPRDVKEIVFRAARRLEIPAVLVANQWISTPLNHPFVTAVRVAGGPDVADRHGGGAGIGPSQQVCRPALKLSRSAQR